MLFISLFIFLIDLDLTGQNEIELNKPIPKNAIIVKDAGFLVMTTSGSLESGILLCLDKKIFEVVLDSSGKVIFASTHDVNYKNNNGMKINDPYEQIKEGLKNGIYEPGWGYYFTSNSKWKICFLDTYILKNGKISDTCMVKYFFQRK